MEAEIWEPHREERCKRKQALGVPGIATRSKDATIGALASLLGARTLQKGSWHRYYITKDATIRAPGIATRSAPGIARSKDAIPPAMLLGARTLLGAPGVATRSKGAIIGAPGIATRSKDATRGSWRRYTRSKGAIIGAPGIATRSKDATRGSWRRY